jgi:polyisoprenoid-binding protein YceI
MIKEDMHKSIILVTGLIFVTANAFASPRTLLPAESQIEFTVKEMGVPVIGVFKQFDAAIDINPAKPEKSHADLRIDIGSLTTGNEEADAIAVAPEWLDKTHTPYATFKSVSIRALGGGDYEAHGTLTIRDQKRDIIVKFRSVDVSGGKTIITGDFIVKRSEFGIGGGVWNEGGIVAEDIPVKVRLTLALTATLVNP